MTKELVRSLVLTVLFSSTPALAQNPDADPEGSGAGPGVPMPYYLEFSTKVDKEADLLTPGFITGQDPEQTLKTKPVDTYGPPYPQDAVDYGLNSEVDALATTQDYLFDDLWNGTGIMILSFTGDWGSGDWKDGVIYEKPDGTCNRLLLHWELYRNPDPDKEPVGEVDALQAYGTSTWSNSMHFSLEGDPDRQDEIVNVEDPTSVFYSTYCGISDCLPGRGGTPLQKEYLPRSWIYNALALSLDPPYTGSEEDVDVDAMMIKDTGTGRYWSPGDRIIFSIKEAGNFHGGEIIKLENNGTSIGIASYLEHGGHWWNTEFDARDNCPVYSRDVDALEMIRSEEMDDIKFALNIPALTAWGSVVLCILLIGAWFHQHGRRSRLT